MKKEKGRAHGRARPDPLSAVEEYLQRAERERWRRFDKRRPGPGPSHIKQIIKTLTRAIREDRAERRKKQG